MNAGAGSGNRERSEVMGTKEIHNAYHESEMPSIQS
jgi:hypothetical protein